MHYGVLGGSFDPIHIGHLHIAKEALKSLAVNKILFIPAGQQWMKPEGARASAQDRLEMIRLAISKNKDFLISDIEVSKVGPSYSVETLEELDRTIPGDNKFTFILGQDTILNLHHWKRVDDLLGLCDFAVMPRSSKVTFDLERVLDELPKLKDKAIYFENIKPLDVSSTDIRNKIRKQEDINLVVPKNVSQFIRRKGLYKI